MGPVYIVCIQSRRARSICNNESATLTSFCAAVVKTCIHTTTTVSATRLTACNFPNSVMSDVVIAFHLQIAPLCLEPEYRVNRC